jgi:hypothetical protein
VRMMKMMRPGICGRVEAADRFIQSVSQSVITTLLPTEHMVHIYTRGVHGSENREIVCLRAVCHIKSIHESHCTLALGSQAQARDPEIDPPPGPGEPRWRDECALAVAIHGRQGLGRALLRRGSVDHGHRSSNGTLQPAF